MQEHYSNNVAASACVQCVCTSSKWSTPSRTVLTPSSSHLPLLFLPPPTPKQARRELRRLKEEARRKHAVAVIWAFWQGLKVPTSPHGVATITLCAICSPLLSPITFFITFCPQKGSLCSLLQISLVFLYKVRKAYTTPSIVIATSLQKTEVPIFS